MLDDDCIHWAPNTASQEGLSLNNGEPNDFSWLAREMCLDECPLCEIGCCVQRLYGNVSMDGVVVVHGVLGAA